MRLGTCLLHEGRTLQGERAQLADFCSATMAGFYAAIDIGVDKAQTTQGLQGLCITGLGKQGIYPGIREGRDMDTSLGERVV